MATSSRLAPATSSWTILDNAGASAGSLAISRSFGASAKGMNRIQRPRLSAGLGSQLAVSRAVVQLPGAAVQISPLRLAEAATQSKAVRDMIVRCCDALLAQIQQSVVCNTVHHVQERLCRWLLQAHDRIDGDTIPLTQEFVSGLLGVQRTTVTAICRVLQADGIIDVRRGRILIRNAGALTRKSCACYGVVRRLNDRACRGFFGAPNP